MGTSKEECALMMVIPLLPHADSDLMTTLQHDFLEMVHSVTTVPVLEIVCLEIVCKYLP